MNNNKINLTKEGINLTKEVKDWHTEKYDIDKENKEDTKKWKDTPCSDYRN